MERAMIQETSSASDLPKQLLFESNCKRELLLLFELTEYIQTEFPAW